MDASLQDLGIKYGSSKARVGFLPQYERFLAPLRHEAFELLEIGVKEGASIRLWHEYFSVARIVGVDINPKEQAEDLPRFTFVQGSQADPALFHRLVRQHAFRLVVDDGSHLWGHQIFTFQTLFPWLEPGGIYICEDLQTSYGDLAARFSGGAEESAAAYFLRIARIVTGRRAQPPSQDEDPMLHFIVNKIESMTFIRSGVVITTADPHQKVERDAPPGGRDEGPSLSIRGGQRRQRRAAEGREREEGQTGGRDGGPDARVRDGRRRRPRAAVEGGDEGEDRAETGEPSIAPDGLGNEGDA